jgi:hypothetical protein
LGFYSKWSRAKAGFPTGLCYRLERFVLTKISEVRVVSWNTAFRGPNAAKRQGKLLHQLAPDLMLLQELNPGSSTVLANAAGADWMVRAIDLRDPE